MIDHQKFIQTIFENWHVYQNLIISALRPLDETQLALQAAPELRSVDENVRHIIGARARWFYQLMGEGGDEFKSLGRWDHRGARTRSSAELIDGLERTWVGMQAAIDKWTLMDWEQTWVGDEVGDPEIITRQWVIWHLIEHDLHHGGEVSLTLGMHGITALAL